MVLSDGFGWAGAVTGILLGLPQLVRLARTRSVEGLSLPAWQALLAVNIGWTAHGIHIGQPPQIVTSALSLISTVPILVLMSRRLDRNLALVLLPGILGAAVMIAVDQMFGTAAYGVAALIPAVIGNAGQSVELVRAAHIRGVSVWFLVLALLNQGVWFTWSILVHDAGTTIATILTGTIALFNLSWYLARRLGLRALAGVP